MNYKRALVGAAGLYVASFIMGVVISLFVGPNVEAAGGPSTGFLLVQVLIAGALSFGAAWWYFTSPTTVANPMNGLYFGGVAVLLGFVFDVILFIPGMSAGYTFADLLSFYAEPWFWVALVAVLVGATAAGHLRTRKNGSASGTITQ